MLSMADERDCVFELVNHPPYSPDFTASGYHLFPNLKRIHLLRTSITVMIGSYLLLMVLFDQYDEIINTNGIRALQHLWKEYVKLKGVGVMFKLKPDLVTFLRVYTNLLKQYFFQI